MRFEDRNINCNIFRDAEAVIKRADSKMKEVNTKKRQYYAQDILGEVEALLSCSYYNSQSTDCLNCHAISCRYIQKYAQSGSLVKSKRKESIINR